MPVATIPLPPKSSVGYLDPSIAGEGVKVEYANGEPLSFTAPPPKPNYPDWSEIKSIQRYFNRTGYEPWPAWFYHPDEEPRLIKDQAEGETIGVYFRKPTADEMARYGVKTGVWDWAQGSLWRPTPYKVAKFDPKNPGHGKEYVDPMRDQGTANRFMVAELAKAITEAQRGNAPAAPAAVDPHMWDQFQQFLAWQKANEVVTGEPATVPPQELMADPPQETSASAAGAEPSGALGDAINTLSQAVNNKRDHKNRR